MVRRALIALLRVYGRSFPIDRGKRLVTQTALDLLRPGHEWVVRRLKDGRSFRMNPADRIFMLPYFLGQYEPEVERVVRMILMPGDVAVDVGSNFGWYSVLFASLVGPSGSVHSFEPVPWIFDELRANMALNGDPSWVTVNRVALGEARGRTRVYEFAGLTQGHSSMSDLGRSDVTVHECDVLLLDEYCRGTQIESIALVKVDVEGAELSVLRGSRDILDRQEPPMWIVELNGETSARFGYTPSQLLGFLAERRYRFVSIRPRELARLPSVEEWRHGDNVLCYRFDVHGDRVARLPLERDSAGPSRVT